ncbi:hypothetical protein Lal_00043211 [Lupinus albus]|nr:hypothetical protein Lal_00043211 [Lupinus albus]
MIVLDDTMMNIFSLFGQDTNNQFHVIVYDVRCCNELAKSTTVDEFNIAYGRRHIKVIGPKLITSQSICVKYRMPK